MQHGTFRLENLWTVKGVAERTKLKEETRCLSGHSMRIGAAQDMIVAGIDPIAIVQAGGWWTAVVLARHVENASASQVHALSWQRLQALASANH